MTAPSLKLISLQEVIGGLDYPDLLRCYELVKERKDTFEAPIFREYLQRDGYVVTKERVSYSDDLNSVEIYFPLGITGIPTKLTAHPAELDSPEIKQLQRLNYDFFRSTWTENDTKNKLYEDIYVYGFIYYPDQIEPEDNGERWCATPGGISEITFPLDQGGLDDYEAKHLWEIFIFPPTSK